MQKTRCFLMANALFYSGAPRPSPRAWVCQASCREFFVEDGLMLPVSSSDSPTAWITLDSRCHFPRGFECSTPRPEFKVFPPVAKHSSAWGLERVWESSA